MDELTPGFWLSNCGVLAGFAHIADEFLNGYVELFEEKQSTTLCWAARNGYTEIVKILLEYNTPISGVRVKDGLPLSWACAGGHLAVVKLLLKYANTSQVNECDGNGRSPLSHAVIAGHFAVTEQLMARKDIDVNKADRSGFSPLHWTIESEPTRKYIILLKYLISDPRVRLAQRDRHGRTILSWAAERGNCNAIKALIQQNHPDVQELLDDQGDMHHGWPPLSWAAFNGQHGAAKLLCSTGKINSQLANTDKRGQNAVSLAADRNHPEIISLLAQYYPQGMDMPEETGRSPLSCAMWGDQNNAETVRTLLRTGLVDVNRRAESGRTPLAYAANAGRADLVRILVEEGGADMDVMDEDSLRPGDGLDVDWRTPLARKELERLRDEKAQGQGRRQRSKSRMETESKSGNDLYDASI